MLELRLGRRQGHRELAQHLAVSVQRVAGLRPRLVVEGRPWRRACGHATSAVGAATLTRTRSPAMTGCPHRHHRAGAGRGRPGGGGGPGLVDGLRAAAALAGQPRRLRGMGLRGDVGPDHGQPRGRGLGAVDGALADGGGAGSGLAGRGAAPVAGARLSASGARPAPLGADRRVASGWPEDLPTLPGVGPYIAAAVGCFAREQPVLPMDVNVRRVLGRRFPGGIDISGDPWRAGQALMEFGQRICSARPRCGELPGARRLPGPAHGQTATAAPPAASRRSRAASASAGAACCAGCWPRGRWRWRRRARRDRRRAGRGRPGRAERGRLCAPERG